MWKVIVCNTYALKYVQAVFKFLFKKIKALTFSGSRLHLFLLTMFPAAENTLSEGTEVAGAQRNLLATNATLGNL